MKETDVEGIFTSLTSQKLSLSYVVTPFAHPRTLLWVAVKRQTHSNSTSVQRLIRGGCSKQQGMQQCSLISRAQGEADPALAMTNVAVNSSRARCWHSVNTRLHFPLGATRQILMGHDRQPGKWVSALLQELWLCQPSHHCHCHCHCSDTVTSLRRAFQLGLLIGRTLDNSRG